MAMPIAANNNTKIAKNKYFGFIKIILIFKK